MTNLVQKIAISAAVAAAGLAASVGAHAQTVSWSIGVGSPGVSVGLSNSPYYPVYSQPVYSAYPAPYSYYAPQPVYVRPAPVYVRPAPVYVQPRAVGWGHHRHQPRAYYPGTYYRY